MPRRARRTARRRRATPYWNKYKPVVPNLGLPGQSFSKLVHLRWAGDGKNNQMVTGAYLTHAYFANRITDIDVSGAGTRDALGTDSYMGSTLGGTQAMYTRYVVLGSKAHIEVIPLTGGPLACPVVCGIRQESLNAGTNTSWLDDAEDRHGSWKIIQSFTNTTVHCVTTYSAKNTYDGFAGVLDNTIVNTRNGSPASSQYHILWMQPLDRATTVAAGAVRWSVVIDYAVLFMDPFDILASV